MRLKTAPRGVFPRAGDLEYVISQTNAAELPRSALSIPRSSGLGFTGGVWAVCAPRGAAVQGLSSKPLKKEQKVCKYCVYVWFLPGKARGLQSWSSPGFSAHSQNVPVAPAAAL